MFKIVTSHVTTLRRKNSARTKEHKGTTSLERRSNSCSSTGLNQREGCFIIKKESNLGLNYRGRCLHCVRLTLSDTVGLLHRTPTITSCDL